MKLPKSLETLLLYKHCFLFGIAVIDVYFENDNRMPKLSKVLNDIYIVRFYHELDPVCYIKVRLGKVIMKNIGKHLHIDKDEPSNGSISKWRRKNRTKAISNQLKSNFFLKIIHNCNYS